MDPDGAQSQGTVGYEHVKAGQIWWFALPVPHNVTGSPIKITAVSLVKVPKGIKVLGYGAYSLEDTEGLPLLEVEGDKWIPHFSKLKNYATGPVEVAAKTSSDIYFLAKMKIETPPQRGTAHGCRFEYEQDGHSYVQTLDCEVELTAK
ncbi:hypothetical protein [Streptomyces sp. NPDC046978]|uniref:hypothetical protein n=1 Tax=Streptomyces sp. NPDC046978 TaxID=3154704 RepID=UPI0034116E19